MVNALIQIPAANPEIIAMMIKSGRKIIFGDGL
jgi:hypothetical protein